MNKDVITTAALPQQLSVLLNIWTDGQINMQKVTRWGIFQGKENFPIREQNDLQHLHGISMLARVLARGIKQYSKAENFDALLLLSAVLIHEEGEGLIHHDTCFPMKSEAKDLEEWSAFSASITGLPEDLQYLEQEAFLLQFAMKDYQSFPDNAQRIMANLRANKSHECHAFACLECFDYLLYVLEQKMQFDNDLIFIQVVRGQFAEMDRLSTCFPYFRNLFWTKETRLWFAEELRQKENRFPGKQGDSTE